MDKFLEQARQIESREAHLLLFGFVGLISPGILTIWFYQPDLFRDVGVLTLILLCTSGTFPVALVNYMIVDSNSSINQLQSFALGIAMLGIASGSLVLVNLWARLEFQHYAILGVALSFLLSFLICRLDSDTSEDGDAAT